MKRAFLILSLLVSTNSFAQPAPGLKDMTKSDWIEDIDFLNKVIQKEFQSFNPEVKPQFQIALESLKKELDQYNEVEIAIKLSQIVAGLEDGHTEIQITQPDIGLQRIPLILYFFEEGLFIVGSHEEYKNLIGYKVKRMGSKSVEEVFELLKGLITHDNDYEILHAGPGYLILPTFLKYLGLAENYMEATFSLISPAGDEIEATFYPKSYEHYLEGPWLRYTKVNNVEEPLSRTPRSEYQWFEYLADKNIIYFYYGAVQDQKGYPKLRTVIKSLFKLIDEKKPDKLVIDLRRNGGGNYHKSRPLIEAIKNRSWLNQEGKIYAISGRTTFSAAMVTCVFLKKETETILVGEPSRGHPNKTDNVEHINLPNSNLRLEYTTIVLKHWPELGDSIWVPVDVEIPVRFKDYAEGRDAVMEFIYREAVVNDQ